MSIVLSFENIFHVRQNNEPKMTQQRRWYLANKEKAHESHRKSRAKFFASLTPEQLAEYKENLRIYNRLHARMRRARNPGKDYQLKLARLAKMTPEERERVREQKRAENQRRRERKKPVAAQQVA